MQEYVLGMEIAFEGFQMLDLADRLHGNYYVKYIKRIKKTTLKEKESKIVIKEWVLIKRYKVYILCYFQLQNFHLEILYT